VKRVTVVGSPGAGKSTFSKRLAAKLNLELIHLDKEYWQPGWVETPKEQWKTRQKVLVERET
jgi:adenylate kinase family enzyme